MRSIMVIYIYNSFDYDYYILFHPHCFTAHLKVKVFLESVVLETSFVIEVHRHFENDLNAFNPPSAKHRYIGIPHEESFHSSTEMLSLTSVGLVLQREKMF